jgi:maleate cis-trans isomerase
MRSFKLGDITLADGPEFDQAFGDEISVKSGLPAVTTAGALNEAIKVLGAQHVAFTSPYVPQLAAEAVDFIEQSGVEVVNQFGYNQALSSLEQNALTPQDAYQMGLKADHPQAELLLISCTDYRALEAVPARLTGTWQTGHNEQLSVDVCRSQATRDRHAQYRGRRLSVYPPELVVDIGV